MPIGIWRLYSTLDDIISNLITNDRAANKLFVICFHGISFSRYYLYLLSPKLLDYYYSPAHILGISALSSVFASSLTDLTNFFPS